LELWNVSPAHDSKAAVSILRLTVSRLRCITYAELEFPPGLSLLYGENGSGKTSLLEAIFLLGRGRSFRTRNTERLIQRGQDHLRVSAEVAAPSGQTVALALEFARDGVANARVGGRTADSLTELATVFPVQVIEPGVHKLIEEGGYRRRRWMDWAVFHAEPQFVDLWQRYTRALKQRNAALRAEAEASVIDTWDLELARLGEAIAEPRRRLVAELQPYWAQTVRALSGLEVELEYLRGWSDGTLLEALRASRSRDEARGLTHAGPHRADVALRLEGRAARDVLSRGQQKLVAAAMNLAQLEFLRATTQSTSTLLLDDPAAELDEERMQRFIEQIKTLGCQLIVTSLHAELPLFGPPRRTFHVEHGKVQSV